MPQKAITNFDIRSCREHAKISWELSMDNVCVWKIVLFDNGKIVIILRCPQPELLLFFMVPFFLFMPVLGTRSVKHAPWMYNHVCVYQYARGHVSPGIFYWFLATFIMVFEHSVLWNNFILCTIVMFYRLILDSFQIDMN